MSLLPNPTNTNVILRVPGSPDIQLGVETIHYYVGKTSWDEKKWKKILIERSLLNPQDDIIVNWNHLSEQNSRLIITRVSDSAGGLENNGSGFTGLPQLPKPPKTYPTPIFDAMMAESKIPAGPGEGGPDTKLGKIFSKYLELVTNINKSCSLKTQLEYQNRTMYHHHQIGGAPHLYFGLIREIEIKCNQQQDKGYWEEEYAKVKKIYNDLPLIRGRGRGVGGERNRYRSKLQEIQAKINSFPPRPKSPNLIKFPTIHNDLANIFGAGPAGAGGGGAAVRHWKRKQRKTQKRKNRRNHTRKN